MTKRKEKEATYVRLTLLDQTLFLDVAEDPRLDAAMSRYADTERDELMTVEGLDGSQIRFLISGVLMWSVSTPDTRAAASLLDWTD